MSCDMGPHFFVEVVRYMCYQKTSHLVAGYAVIPPGTPHNRLRSEKGVPISIFQIWFGNLHAILPIVKKISQIK